MDFSTSEGKIIVTIHYEEKYDNRFWDGKQVVLGDGDGEIFSKFSGLDTIAGALAYPIIQERTKLPYLGQQGALTVHLSDAFSAMVVQWHEKQPAGSARWLIGSDTFSPKIKGSALRSMKAPGSAYDDPTLGKDPQPAHMKDYVKTSQDNGGST